MKLAVPRPSLAGSLLVLGGLALYLAGVLFAVPRALLQLGPSFRAVN
jgi:hypothetical protein